MLKLGPRFAILRRHHGHFARQLRLCGEASVPLWFFRPRVSNGDHVQDRDVSCPGTSSGKHDGSRQRRARQRPHRPQRPLPLRSVSINERHVPLPVWRRAHGRDVADGARALVPRARGVMPLRSADRRRDRAQRRAPPLLDSGAPRRDAWCASSAGSPPRPAIPASTAHSISPCY